MRAEDLHLLISEEIYILDNQKKQVISTHPSPKKEEITKPKTPKVSVAFIHTSSDKEELDLLGKIIGACKLEPSQYKVLNPDEEVDYDKAIIFSDSSAVDYQPVSDGNNQKLYSKPLGTLIHSKEEKAKLWGALKQFI